jgi:dynein heavy chain
VLEDKFKGLCKSITKNIALWKDYYLSPDPLHMEFPDGWNGILDSFERMLLVKIFRPEKLMFAISDYVLE